MAKTRRKKTDDVDRASSEPTIPAEAAAPPPDENPGACCPHCGCRHAPVVFTRRAGNRTIRTRRCRNCKTQFREIAAAFKIA